MSSHDELVRRAVRWLRRQHYCATVFAEMTTASSETPDVIGWGKGYSRVVEVKTSRSDFRRDLRKPHMLDEQGGMGGQRWYLVPPDLLRADDIPVWCGLAYAGLKSIVVIKAAPERSVYDFRAEARVLTSALRRTELGSRFNPKTARWEPFANRDRRQRKDREHDAIGAAHIARQRLA